MWMTTMPLGRLKHVSSEYRSSRMTGPTLTDVNRAIDNIPATLQRAMENLKQQTGWVGTVLLGGPDPRTGTFLSFS